MLRWGVRRSTRPKDDQGRCGVYPDGCKQRARQMGRDGTPVAQATKQLGLPSRGFAAGSERKDVDAGFAGSRG